MSTKVASLLGADIYASDMELFESGRWLNDSCINYCFRRIEKELQLPKHFLLMDPAVVAFMRLQCTEDSEFADLAEGIELKERIWLFVPVNDCGSFDAQSNHWSFLLFHIPTGKSYHFDSLGNFNYESAVIISSRIIRLLLRYGGDFGVYY
jgi:Ulp1 family protease